MTERFAKKKKKNGSAGAQPGIFQEKGGGGGRSVELGAFDKISSKTPEKEAPHENILEFLLLDTLKAKFWNGKFNPKMGTIRAFF